MRLRFLGEERAQAGIGTLIIFIAMILVAAVAASVLLQTSGRLQQKASAAGQEAVEQVSTKLVVQSVVGYTTDKTEGIKEIILTVYLAAGSSPITLNDMLMSYQSEDYYISGIIYNSSNGEAFEKAGSNQERDFYMVPLKEVTSNDLLETGEIMELHYWIDDGTTDLTINSNTQFTMTLTPQRGSPTTITATTPAFIQYNYTALM